MKKDIISVAPLAGTTFYSLSVAGETNNKGCMEYEPSVVSLTGALLEQNYVSKIALLLKVIW